MILGIAAIVAFVLFLLTQGEIPQLLFIALAILIVAIIVSCGANAVETANTVTKTEMVSGEVTKYHATEQHCYVVVNDEYLIEVTPEQYARINDGDKVLVEVTIKTVFGETTKTARLKG
jgi:uncharacterized membrane protein YeiB